MLPRSQRYISTCQFANESDIVILIYWPAHSLRWSITRSCLETSSIHGGPGRLPRCRKVRVYWCCCCIWLHGTLASVWVSRGGNCTDELRLEMFAVAARARGDAERRDTCRARAHREKERFTISFVWFIHVFILNENTAQMGEIF